MHGYFLEGSVLIHGGDSVACILFGPARTAGFVASIWFAVAHYARWIQPERTRIELTLMVLSLSFRMHTHSVRSGARLNCGRSPGRKEAWELEPR